MKKNENVITMGSSIIDFYMEGYDEGKNDEVDVIASAPKNKKPLTVKERAAARRKKAYFKSKGRMAQLDKVAHYTPDAKDEAVVMGMLRSHQLPISDPILAYGCSIGNKRRQDSTDHQLAEHMSNLLNDDIVSA